MRKGLLGFFLLCALGASAQTITALAPSCWWAGYAPKPVEITGANFNSKSRVLVNGGQVSRTVLSSTRIVATVPAYVTPQTAIVQVVNPPKGKSNFMAYTVVAPVKVQLAVVPTNLRVGEVVNAQMSITGGCPAP